MGEVIMLPVETRLTLPAERVLSAAIEADLSRALVIGLTKDGQIYFAGTGGDLPAALWDLERAKALLLQIGDGL